MFAAARFRFPYNTPLTKEAYCYRAIYEEHYPQASDMLLFIAASGMLCDCV